jgi:hypothetical protein
VFNQTTSPEVAHVVVAAAAARCAEPIVAMTEATAMQSAALQNRRSCRIAATVSTHHDERYEDSGC